MTTHVLPSIKRPSASNTACSDSASKPEVGSSKRRIGVLRIMAPAIALRWRRAPGPETPPTHPHHEPHTVGQLRTTHHHRTTPPPHPIRNITPNTRPKKNPPPQNKTHLF